MLGRGPDVVPPASALIGGANSGAKRDGYRSILQSANGEVRLWSRNKTSLSKAFPDVTEAAAAQVPSGVVLDGELVAWIKGRLSFDHLQQRMASGPAAVSRLARQHPAS